MLIRALALLVKEVRGPLHGEGGPTLERESCTIASEVLHVADFDGDGKLELGLDVVSVHKPPPDNRGMWNHEYAWPYYRFPSDCSSEQSLSRSVQPGCSTGARG